MNLTTLLGRRIKELRKAKKMSQAELAEATGLSDNYIALVEQGKRSASLTTLEKIASSLKVSYEELFSFPTMDKRKDAEKRLLEILGGQEDKLILLVSEIAETLKKHLGNARKVKKQTTINQIGK